MIQFILIGLVISSSPGVDNCSTYISKQLCDESGYCKWSSTVCQAYTSNQDCYRIDEIGACRTGGIYQINGLCQSLDILNIEYKNVCGITTIIDYNYVRYEISTDGFATNSIAGLTIPQLKIAIPQANYLFQVLSINLQIALNQELQDILDLYKIYEIELLKSTTHPYYIEKALFNTIQNLRDDQTTLTLIQKQNTIIKFWNLAEIHLKRMLSYSKHYQTNYYFLNFAQTTFSRLFLSINGQEHTTTISWTRYQINGYIQIISYTPKLFGINDALTDVIFVNVVSNDGTSFTQIENMKVTYIQNSGTLTSTIRQLKFIADKTIIPHTFGTTTISSPSCDSIERRCDFTLSTPLIDSSFAFYIQQ